ncbi:dedicator of cytokinesis protein 7-like isoform X3 [Daphnia pulex]|uniref:dedicator of cytokinesis protein 7-like isoform X3 n=1 Tax=Daphnia pulex TaxID=6669 RepID=UPI001EE015E8|nr:dedicator of cytokinesis protein 7-like isoform X3 [Daphnia pulex]
MSMPSQASNPIGQRPFVQRLHRQHASEVRRAMSSASQMSDGYQTSRTVSYAGSIQSAQSFTWNEALEPLDYEDVMNEHATASDRDPLKLLLSFPLDDLQLHLLPRPWRTLQPITPPEPLESLNSHVRDCVRCYTSPWLVVQHRYQDFSSGSLARQSASRLNALAATPRQEFEIDDENDVNFNNENESTAVIDPVSTKANSIRSSSSVSDTPRGSWATFDLRQTASDPPLPGLLDRLAPDVIDNVNKIRRNELQLDTLFALYPPQDDEDIIERRCQPDMPIEHLGHRILVKCTQLQLELEIEPIYASMALYDAKEKKKISENFYFDLNSDSIKHMLATHIPFQDVSTLSRSCTFSTTYPSTDLFLVVKLEKVLQGDINECTEPYIKDDKNREKVKANAVACCERLGRYRMPFAWTGIHLHSILHGASNIDREKDKTNERESAPNEAGLPLGANSLGSGSWSRRGSLERRGTGGSHDKRSSWSSMGDEIGSSLDNFRPVTLTVSSFFKQEGERLRDDDLYKYLHELRRSNNALKRLKCIPGTLKLEVSPCPEENKCSLTPELAKLHPYPDDKIRPTKELIEFPPREVYTPFYTYRNLLYVYPKNLNFANRGSARNISVRIQFMCGEQETHAMPVIFGKSSCAEFSSDYFTAVTYHNKCPDFYDEVKIKLPANLKDCHHLLFTFYHVSCQRKVEQTAVETVVGYSWLPMLKDGSLQTGEFSLPVMLDPPPPNYLYINPEVMLPGTRWVDNHKGIFNIVIEAITSVHTLDRHLDRFLNICSALEENRIVPHIGEANMESSLKQSIGDLTNSKTEQMVKFLPLILEKLIGLIVSPPLLNGQLLKCTSVAFDCLVSIVGTFTEILDHLNDLHGRNSLLATYVHFQACVPQESRAYGPAQHRPLSIPPQRKQHRRTSQPEVHLNADNLGLDAEINSCLKGAERNSNSRGGVESPTTSRPSLRKLLHEEIALLWAMSTNTSRDAVFSNAWFFFELMVKSMVEYLGSSQKLDSPRKQRFPERFLEDIGRLVSLVTVEILSRQRRDGGESKSALSLNIHLSFFLHDLLSVMDRGFVFSLIRCYIRTLAEDKALYPNEIPHITSLKLDFLRVICSHEHFVALNLPYSTPLCSSTASSPSPSPSVSSSNSQSSFVSTLVGVSSSARFAELTGEFRQQHFLIGLVLSELAAVFDLQSPALHARAANLVRNLLTSHDWDPRYSDASCKARVATLYLPLIGVLLEALPHLFDWNSETKGRPLVEGSNEEQDSSTVNPAVAQAIAGIPVDQIKGKVNAETTRHLLICSLWVMRHVEEAPLKNWWSELNPAKLHRLLELLFICVSGFEYRGKRGIRRCIQQRGGRTTENVKSRLEDLILGQGSARSDLILRRRVGGAAVNGSGSVVGNSQFYTGIASIAHTQPTPERNPSPNSSLGVPPDRQTLRWRKDTAVYRSTNEAGEKPRVDVELDAYIEGNLSTQTSLTILDMLELIVQVVSQHDNLQMLLPVALRVLLHVLGCCQSTALLQNAFATQRALVYKLLLLHETAARTQFPGLLFDEETELCADLCLRLLRHCSNSISSIRSQASASLYLLMRQNFEIGNNFARVKMQVTMSLSSLVGTSAQFNEEALRRSLKTILVYAEEDTELQDTTFPEQVQDLVFNLHMILSDTVKMKEFQEDPEMLLDLMYRIAKGYQNSPDLRLTWLANMAQKHSERGNHAEAAMCLVHSAALVSEYLCMLEDQKYLPVGAMPFERLSANAVEESAVSDDVLCPDEEGFCTGKYFTENGLIGLLEQSASSFQLGGMFEAMNEVYKILTPIAEAHRDFKKLANIHGKLSDAFTRIEQQHGKRMFGTYFRVGFYGPKFGDLDGEEFIYKEPTLTKLPEISHRLENFYCERFGAAAVVMIKDSNLVDVTKLNTERAYIQITYVEPYFDVSELRHRLTVFERNFNIKRFMYATPFTPDGRAHGELHEQYKRKTVLTTANHFPYVKTRIQVAERRQVVLTPIEVAIEDIQKKTTELALATIQEPPDPKILQMVLQGCIGTTVNQGPLEVASVFLSDLADPEKTSDKFQLKLRLCFKDFSKRCNDALRRNKNLIGPDQLDYQKELERNYRRFTERLAPLINIDPSSPNGHTTRNRRNRR